MVLCCFTDDSRLQSALLLPEDEDDGEMDKVDKDKNVTADADILRRYKTKVYTLDVLASPHHKLGTDWSEAKQMALIEEMSAPLSFTLAGIAYHTNPAEMCPSFRDTVVKSTPTVGKVL